MPDFRKMYFQLFASIADALDALKAGNPERSREILILAQLRGEESYISPPEDSEGRLL